MRWRVLGLALGVWLMATATSGQPANLTGFWEIAATDAGSGAVSTFVYVQQDGRQTKVTDVRTGRTYEGTIAGDRFSFKRGSPAGQSGARGGGGTVEYGLSFKSGDTLVGVAATPAGEQAITMTRLASLWACSNHTSPVHVAKSESDMQDLARRHGCSGWRKLQPPK